jgi:hypothetical protein
MTRYAKIKMISFLALGLALLTSCQANTPTKETEIPTEESKTQTTSENTMVEKTKLETGETTVLNDKSIVYVSDYEQYGADVAKVFYQIRTQGDPDWYEDAVYFENGTDIVFTPHSPKYTTSDEKWELIVSEISESLLVENYHNNMNLEKKTEDGWQRYGVLVWNHRIKRAPEDNLQLLPGRTFSIPVEAICPSVTPGQYRFIVYLAVRTDKDIEHRKYYVPFEVIE